MTSEAIIGPYLETTPVSEAIQIAARGYMHMDYRVFEVADFIVEVKKAVEAANITVL